MRGCWILVMAIGLLTVCPAVAAPADALVEKAGALADSDPAAALALMKQAAATGDPEAINGLATFVNMGVGQPADPQAARALMEQALAKGSVGARLNLGTALLADDDPANDGRGIGLLAPLAGNDKLGGLTYYPLGRAMLLGLGGRPQDIDGGLAILEAAERVDAGNPDLLFLLARGHQNGWGAWEPDPVKAASYFRRSAELGDSRAQWHYGMALLDGEGVAPNAPGGG
jgi:TPR repeat protein